MGYIYIDATFEVSHILAYAAVGHLRNPLTHFTLLTPRLYKTHVILAFLLEASQQSPCLLSTLPAAPQRCISSQRPSGASRLVIPAPLSSRSEPRELESVSTSLFVWSREAPNCRVAVGAGIELGAETSSLTVRPQYETRQTLLRSCIDKKKSRPFRRGVLASPAPLTN